VIRAPHGRPKADRGRETRAGAGPWGGKGHRREEGAIEASALNSLLFRINLYPELNPEAERKEAKQSDVDRKAADMENGRIEGAKQDIVEVMSQLRGDIRR
jgi:hypothetical protein